MEAIVTNAVIDIIFHLENGQLKVVAFIHSRRNQLHSLVGSLSETCIGCEGTVYC